MAYDFILKGDMSAQRLLYMCSACTTHSLPGLSPDAKSLREEEHHDDCCADQWHVICGSFDCSVDRSSGDGNGNGSREVTGDQVRPTTSPTRCLRYAAYTLGSYDLTPLRFLIAPDYSSQNAVLKQNSQRSCAGCFVFSLTANLLILFMSATVTPSGTGVWEGVRGSVVNRSDLERDIRS
jgi:hypothetical protein